MKKAGALDRSERIGGKVAHYYFRWLSGTRLDIGFAAYVILALLSATACRAKRLVTVEDVAQIVKNHVHTGSDKEEVASFVDSLKINSLRITHSDGFKDSERLRFDDLDEQKRDRLGERLKEYYDVAIMDVVPSTETFMVSIVMRFYFDENGKLLDYTIKEDTSFR